MPVLRALARMMAFVLLASVLAGCAAADDLLAMPADVQVTEIPVVPGAARIWPAATLTPFQPAANTPTPTLTQPAPLPTRPATAATTRPAPTRTTMPPAPALNFWGIDFGSSTQRVTIQITPPNTAVNRGRPILITFYPSGTCVFGDKHACVHSYRATSGADILFLSVHSGAGGEGQAYRNALEGTGLNQAGYSLKQIQANLRALEGAEVTLAQGQRVVRGLVLKTNGRVPARQLQNYFNAPLEQALARAASADPALKPAVSPNGPELVFETCGWKSSEEPWAAGVTSTTASVYLGVIQKAP